MDVFENCSDVAQIFFNSVLLILLAVIWGSQFVAVKIGLGSFAPLLFAALRFDIATVVLAIYLISRGFRIAPRCPIESMEVVSSGMLIFVVSQGLYHVGQQHVSTGVASILYSTIPLLVSFFALVFLPQSQRSLTEFGGICIGFLGVAIIVRPDIGGISPMNLFGRSIILLSSAAFALATVLSKVFLKEIRLPVLSRLLWAMLIGSLGLHGLSLALGEAVVQVYQLSLIELLPILYLAIVPSIIAYCIFYHLIDRVGPIEVSLVTYLVPVCTAILGWIMLDERLSDVMIVGFLFVLFGFILVKRPELSEVS